MRKLCQGNDCVRLDVTQSMGRHVRHFGIRRVLNDSLTSCILDGPQPSVPSSRYPVSTYRSRPRLIATERNSTSTAGRVRFSLGPRVKRSLLPSSIRCRSGTAVYTVPATISTPCSAARTGARLPRGNTCGKRLGPFGVEWHTTKIAAGKSSGNASARVTRARTPPAKRHASGARPIHRT